MPDALLVRHFLRRFLENDLVSPDADRHEVLAVTVGCSVMLGFFLFEALYFRKRPVTERHLLGSLLFTATGLVGACFLTGSIRSPFVPLLFAPTVTAFAASAMHSLRRRCAQGG